MKRLMVQLVLILLFVCCFLTACSDSSTDPELENVSISFGVSNNLSKSASLVEIDSIKILVRNLKLTSVVDDSLNVKTDEFIVKLNLDGDINTVALASLPEGAYDKIKFEIHRLENSAVPPDAEFKDGNERYSVIVKGKYDAVPFVYRSRKSAKQIIHLAEPVNIVAGGITNFTLIVNPNEWFEKGGDVLNPTDPANENDIDNNIKASFRVAIVDNNKDGIED